MYFSVILVLAVALHAKELSQSVTTTDEEETFVANTVKKTVDDLERQLGELSVDAFETKIREVLYTPELTTKLTSLVNKAREPAWMRDRLIGGLAPMVSSTLSYEIKEKLGDMTRASAELDKNTEFKERYNSAEQFIIEVLTRHFSDIETKIMEKDRKVIPAHGTEIV